MMPKNYDPTTYLYWYRKVDSHPDSAVNSIAEAFCNRVASWLEIATPRIFWFEEAAFGQAKEEWTACGELKNSAWDPLRLSCVYFRWLAALVDGGAAGYTHNDSPRGIMINVRCAGQELLKTIAEECFHVYQDLKHGSGWRARTSNEIVEREAKEFLRLKAAEIQIFLEHWEHPPHPDSVVKIQSQE